MRRQSRINQRTRRLTLTAMLAALSVALLYVGGLLDVMEISAVAATSLFVLFSLRETGLLYALSLYAATSFLAFLLVRPSLGVLYLLFGGLYPLFKFPLERHRRPLPLLFKLLYLNVIITAVELLTVFVFALPFEGWLLLLFLYALANPTFLLFDKLLDRLLVLYEARLRPRIAQYLS
jgi:hypothetical protein